MCNAMTEKPTGKAKGAPLLDAAILDDIPRSPGIYIMKDASGRVIYVGKAQELRARVRQYLTPERDTRASVPFLMRRVAAIDTIVTTTEKEALLLEETLIKEHQPRYNVFWRDDKTYLSLRIDMRKPYPKLEIVRVRRKPSDGARGGREKVLYFGPYSSAKKVRQTVKMLHEIFPLRQCSDVQFREAQRTGRPCLNCQMRKCYGPCTGAISPADYALILCNVIQFLRGQGDELVADLKQRMEVAAGGENFEEAARLRDQLAAVGATLERQRVISTTWGSRDVFGLYREADELQIGVLHVRDGRLLETTTRAFSKVTEADEAFLGAFLLTFYGAAGLVPPEVVVPIEPDDAASVAEVLAERRGGKVELVAPKRGEKHNLVELAAKNARNAFEAARDRTQLRRGLLDETQRALRLRRLPERIDCFDMSNIAGAHRVGVMVVFRDGEPAKAEYRKFRIRSVELGDDYAMMREVLARRYTRAQAEGGLPDLIVIDGGKGQLNVAGAVLHELGLDELDVVSLAKDKAEWQDGALKLEKVYLPNVKDPVGLKRHSPVRFLLERIRDEAHRFAITYHKQVRRKAQFASVLDAVPGVGPARKQALLRHFGSVARVREATVDELAAAPKMTDAAAQAVYAALHEEA
ncbi:MAG: excinuclease ABC subunit UvrC [Verrucomicrobia bacterium]|nr:excinuclease ABC subunit UvrC [Verrucomicrobiota bacterium]